jgi:hypothetical protein
MYNEIFNGNQLSEQRVVRYAAAVWLTGHKFSMN